MLPPISYTILDSSGKHNPDHPPGAAVGQLLHLAMRHGHLNYISPMQECKATQIRILINSAARSGKPTDLGRLDDGICLDLQLSKVDADVEQQGQSWSELAQGFANITRLSIHTILTVVFRDIESDPFKMIDQYIVY